MRNALTRGRLLAATAVTLLLAAAAVSAALLLDDSGASAAPARTARVGDAVRKVLHANRTPGAIVGFWQEGEEPIVEGYGVQRIRGGEPMVPGLHMRIGSETKTFTATAILRFSDEGKLRLDDPVGRYVRGVPRGGRITIRDLGEMRSGIVSYTATKGWAAAFLADPHRRWQPRELLRYSFAQPPAFAPGARFEYSNANFVLLGLVVEAASGESYRRYVTRHVLEPLGLDDTMVPTGSRLPRPHPTGYTAQTKDGSVAVATDWNPSWGGAAGVMTSTVRDLGRWAKDVATGALLRPATQRERERFRPAPGLEPSRYGFGLFEADGWIGHNGSIPGFESLALYLPEQRATLVVLVNSDINLGNGGEELTTQLGRAITKVLTPRHVFSLSAG